MVIQYTDNTCTTIATTVGIPLSGGCIPVTANLYAKADFLSDTKNSVVSSASLYSVDFPLGAQTLVSGDQKEIFSFAVYSDNLCTSPVPLGQTFSGFKIGNIPASTTPGIANGCYSAGIPPGFNATTIQGRLPSPNFFKTAVLPFCSYSEMANYINAQAGQGLVGTSYADASCSKMTDSVSQNNLPIEAMFMTNGVCVPTYGGAFSAVTVNCGSGSDGQLAFTVQGYSDIACKNKLNALRTFSSVDGQSCYPITDIQYAGLPFIGKYITGRALILTLTHSIIILTHPVIITGFCQTTPTMTSATTAVVKATQALTGTINDSPAFRMNFITSIKKALADTTVTVSIVSIVTTTSRRTFRQLLAAGATISYNVASSAKTEAALQSTVASSTVATALAASLASSGVTAASPATAVVTAVATSSAPSLSPVASTSASAVGSAACFAGTEQVRLESGAFKAMADVRVGDRVLSVNAKGEQVFSDVVYLPHGTNTYAATFAQIDTESGRNLKMTTNHILPAGACALSSLPLVAASQIAVGDCVQTVSGREKVVSVGKVEGKGIYTIIAMEELIVVNGIIATPYGGINPTLANIYYNLHRLVYTLAGQMAIGRRLQWATEGLWVGLSTLTTSA